MDYLDSNFRSRLLQSMLFIQFDDESLPSSLIPGGETSPALAFRLYSKGSPLPDGKFQPGDFSDLPLDQSHVPTTPSEVYIAAEDAMLRARYVQQQQVEQQAADSAAKQAEIDAKIAYADAHMNNNEPAG